MNHTQLLAAVLPLIAPEYLNAIGHIRPGKGNRLVGTNDTKHKLRRNGACPCGSGKKLKKCCRVPKPVRGEAANAIVVDEKEKS